MVRAFDQAGYFTSAQALEVGYSYQAQKYHADRGNWVRVDRGLYRIPYWPSSRDDSFIRWSLWSGSRAVVSHQSAAAVHELSDLDPARVHLTVGPGFHRRDAAIVLHVADLTDSDVERRGTWSVTTPVRTLLDIADDDTTAQEHVEQAVVDALRLGKTSRRILLRAADGADDRAALRLERAITGAEAQL